MPDDTLLTVFRFDVLLTVDNADQIGLTNPLCDGAFAECDGLDMTMEPRTVREGGSNTKQRHLVGPVSYSNLTLRRGVTANLDLWKWFGAASRGRRRGIRARGLVVMRDAAGTARLRFDLEGCLPVRLKAPSFNAKDAIIALEELQVAYDAFTVSVV